MFARCSIDSQPFISGGLGNSSKPEKGSRKPSRNEMYEAVRFFGARKVERVNAHLGNPGLLLHVRMKVGILSQVDVGKML